MKYFCGRIYLGADDVEGWVGSGAGRLRGEIEAASRLAAREKGRKNIQWPSTPTLTQIDGLQREGWMDLTSLSYIKLGIYYNASPRCTLHPESLMKQWGDGTLIMGLHGSIHVECRFYFSLMLFQQEGFM